MCVKWYEVIFPFDCDSDVAKIFKFSKFNKQWAEKQYESLIDRGFQNGTKCSNMQTFGLKIGIFSGLSYIFLR